MLILFHQNVILLFCSIWWPRARVLWHQIRHWFRRCNFDTRTTASARKWVLCHYVQRSFERVESKRTSFAIPNRNIRVHLCLSTRNTAHWHFSFFFFQNIPCQVPIPTLSQIRSKTRRDTVWPTERLRPKVRIDYMHEFSAASQQSLVASYNEMNDNSLYGFSCAVTLGIEWFLLDL
jgi:hypothetical protein